MPRKIDISQMTSEEIVDYAEKVNQQNRDRVTKYYKILLKPILRNIKFDFKSVRKRTRDSIIK